MIEQLPVQAMYIPDENQLEYAWWLCMGTLLWATMYVSNARKNKLPLWRKNDIAMSVISAIISYTFAIEFLDVAVVADDWRKTIANYPNSFMAFVGFTSHNLPTIYDWALEVIKKKVSK